MLHHWKNHQTEENNTKKKVNMEGIKENSYTPNMEGIKENSYTPNMEGIKENSYTPLPRLFPFSQRGSNSLAVVCIDHCYAKPWSSHPDASNARPTQTLFMEKPSRLLRVHREDDFIDVDGEDEAPLTLYDVPKAKAMMTDCDRFASVLRPDYSDTKEDWEDLFTSVRTTWTVQQNRIFAKVMKVLQADRLARLSIKDSKNEPIQRRLQIDKAAKRVRFAFANIGWDKTTVWIHNLLLEKLRGQLLTSYLEILQTLKEKIPSLIDRLLAGTTCKLGNISGDSLSGLLKNNWDPVIAGIIQQKPKKLPDNPLLLFISGTPLSTANPTSSQRQKFWLNQLSSMGKVVNVVPVNNSTSMSTANYVESLIATTRSKILEMKENFPKRLIVLIGWNIGALVAVHVSIVENVHAVVCLGFPTMGISGNSGEVDDAMYNCKTTSLFIIGQHASTTNIDCLEDMRERLRVETGLILVGGCDDNLRMARAKKRRYELTQATVDRCIMEEMYDFLCGVLSHVIMHPENIDATDSVKKQKKRKQKDMSSATGSQTVNRPVKPAKKIRMMKISNVATGEQTTLNNLGNLGKNVSAKKKLSKMLPSAANPNIKQKQYLHLTLPVITSSPRQGVAAGSSTPSPSEAAAIASAPELSTLLQSMNTTATKYPVTPAITPISSKISSSAASSLLCSADASSPTLPLKSAGLTSLSKFLTAAGLLESDALDTLSKEYTGSLSDEPASPYQPKLLTDRVSDTQSIDLDLEDFPELADPTLVSEAPHVTKKMDKEQFSSSISMPLSLDIGKDFLCTAVNTQAVATGKMNLLSDSTLKGQTHHGADSTFAPNFQDDFMPQASETDSLSFTSASPKSSMINLGNDTVYLKENPPSKTSSPGTVSVDLGQIASGYSNKAVKVQSSSYSMSKITLIPKNKYSISISSSSSSASSSCSNSPDRLQLRSSPILFSQQTAASQTHNTQTHQIITINKPQPRFATAVSSSGIQILSGVSVSQARALSSTATVLQSSSKISLSGISSSQLMSTLSSPNSPVIRFKLKPAETSSDSQLNTLHETPDKFEVRREIDETDGSHNQTPESSRNPFVNSSLLPSFIDLTDDSPPAGAKLINSGIKAKFSTVNTSLNVVNSPVTTGRQLSNQSNNASNPNRSEAMKNQGLVTTSSTCLSKTESSGTISTCSSHMSETRNINVSTMESIATPIISNTSSINLSSVDSLVKTSVNCSPRSNVSMVTKDSHRISTLSSFSANTDLSVVKDVIALSSLKNQTKFPSNDAVEKVPEPTVTVKNSEDVCDLTLSPTTINNPLSPTSPQLSSSASNADSNIDDGSKSTKLSTYTATPKTVLTTVGSTRTRRIKVPKQYDL